MFVIWSAEQNGYYHPDHTYPVHPGWALAFDDIGEAGYVADQLNDRDQQRVVTVGINGLRKLSETPWEVVDGTTRAP